MGSTKAKPLGDLHDAVKRRLAERDIRYTGGRRAIVSALHRVSGPRSTAELHTEIDVVPLSSLYRSLTVLDDAGVLDRHHDADGLARFELAEWLGGHHHHLVCVECGTFEDVELDPDEERAVAAVVDSIGRRTGYVMSGHVLEFEGRCRRCRT